ncbi:MAG: tol-pal system protein YbgF [Hyphomicrobiales bacterium]
MASRASIWRRSCAVTAAAVYLALASPAFAQDGDALAARVSKLEAEIATLKTMVATLQSLVQTKPPEAQMRDSVPPSNQDDIAPRVEALETQIGALTNQLETIGKQMTRLEEKLDAAPQNSAPAKDVTPEPEPAPDTQAAAPPLPDVTPEPEPEPNTQAAAPPLPDVAPEPPPAPKVQAAPASQPQPVFPPDVVDEADPSKPRWYGPRPGEETDGPQDITPPGATGALPQSTAALPNEDAQALYEEGYGAFLQKDYAAAEKAFHQMVSTYPDDPLAGSAQYWVGESYYVRKQYKKAADTFLTGYRKYSGSDKAPDTLLRLGMSLAALGQSDAACSTFKELGDKFPDAPDYVSAQAKTAAGKAGCK